MWDGRCGHCSIISGLVRGRTAAFIWGWGAAGAMWVVATTGQGRFRQTLPGSSGEGEFERQAEELQPQKESQQAQALNMSSSAGHPGNFKTQEIALTFVEL